MAICSLNPPGNLAIVSENEVKSPESSKNAKRAKPVRPQKKPLSIEELHRQMMARGLITRLPDPDLDIDDDDPDDQPVLIEGEPLSETIIRERRRGDRRTSSIPARWSNATSRRPASPGFAASAPQLIHRDLHRPHHRRRSQLRHIGRTTAKEKPCRVPMRIVDSPPLSPTPRRALCCCRGDGRPAGRRHAAGDQARALRLPVGKEATHHPIFGIVCLNVPYHQ